MRDITMADTYDYAVIRVVPRVERGEFVNAGVIVCCASKRYLEARVELDEKRLLALDPAADIATIRANLATIPRICAGGPDAGPIGKLSIRERFDWLVAPRSTIIQTAAVHMGRCDRLASALDPLLDRMVRTPAGADAPPGGPDTLVALR
jgi:hypothetical protein